MTSPPNIGDFSKQATKRAVLGYTLQNPITMYGTGIGLLGTLAVGLFGATALPATAAVGGLSIGVGSWLYNYVLRGEKIAARYAEELYTQLQHHREQVVEKLKQDLASLDSAPLAVSALAEQASRQFEMIGVRFETLKRTLSSKMDPHEFTFTRYISTAEQVYLAVLDNTLIVASILHSISTVDVDYIQERLSELEGKKSPEEADRTEHNAILERGKLFEAQLAKADSLLAKNEIALTELDKTTAALAELKTLKGQARLGLESAISEMEGLAKRVRDYALEE